MASAKESPVPPKKVNRIGLAVADYKGKPSTLCDGCGHDAISSQLTKAFYELGIPPHQVAKLSGTARATIDMDESGASVGQNQPPTAVLNFTPSSPRVNADVTFDVSDSTDPEEDLDTWQITDYGDGNTSEQFSNLGDAHSCPIVARRERRDSPLCYNRGARKKT